MVRPARRVSLPLLLLALPISACAPGTIATLGQAPAAVLQISQPPVSVRLGDDLIVPLTNGTVAFAAVRSQLQSARRSIDVEMYEFQREDLVSMLVAAARRGITVTGIMDPSERSSRAAWNELAQNGIRVVPFPIERRAIDHVKLLVVDGERGIMGGINWGRHSNENEDFDVLVSGPVAANLERVFEQDLATAGQMAAIPPSAPDSEVQVLTTRPGEAIRNDLLDLIASARRSIDAEAYVLSDALVLQALEAAARSGIRVRVLLDPTQPQNVQAEAALRSAGATAAFFSGAAGQLLHAKAGVFDGARVLFGSCNWSRSGFTRNHELDLDLRSPEIAHAFLVRMSADWAQAVN
jgi:phosphatidylserine/phosphatidylglycerophosphate/cardiolipin synthase-like enzyme